MTKANERSDINLKGSRNGRVLHVPIMAWRIARKDIYASLGLKPNGHIPPDFTFHGKLWIAVGTKAQVMTDFEVRVRDIAHTDWTKRGEHRIHVRCPHCHTWTPFGRLHQHILTKRCCEIEAKS